MNCRTLLALSLVAALACAGASTDADPTEPTDPTVADAEPVRPMEPVEDTTKLTEGPADPSALEGADWTLVEMGGDPSLAEDASITLRLDGENLSGRSGCNLYQSSMAMDGATVTVDRIASTKRACPPPVMKIESAFLAALAGVESWEMDGDRLRLGYRTAGGDEGDLVFERSAEP